MGNALHYRFIRFRLFAHLRAVADTHKVRCPKVPHQTIVSKSLGMKGMALQLRDALPKLLATHTAFRESNTTCQFMEEETRRNQRIKTLLLYSSVCNKVWRYMHRQDFVLLFQVRIFSQIYRSETK